MRAQYRRRRRHRDFAARLSGLQWRRFAGRDLVEDFFEKFDERGLALLHQDTTARGQKSNFNKLISRETEDSGRGSGAGRRTGARGRSTSTRGRSRRAGSSQTSSRGARKKTTAKKSSSRRGSRSTASSSSRSRAGSRKSLTSGRASSRSASTRSRTAPSKRSSRSISSRNRGSGSRSAGTKRTSTRSAARKSASTARSESNRSRTNERRAGSNRTSSSKTSQSRAGRSSTASRILTDHDEIRQWAEERNANPACVRGTGRKKNDMGMIRLDFPGYSGARSLQEIDWDDWFRQFDDNHLALVVQDSTARGQRSNFNKIIGRETAQAREQGSHASRRHPERGRKTEPTARISGSRAQVKSTRGSNRGPRTASVRGQHREQERRAA